MPSDDVEIVPSGAYAAARCVVHDPKNKPATTPTMARSRFSVMTMAASMRRLAPSVARMASSRRRSRVRARERLATFAQAISRSTTAAPMSKRRTRRMGPKSRSWRGVTTIVAGGAAGRGVAGVRDDYGGGVAGGGDIAVAGRGGGQLGGDRREGNAGTRGGHPPPADSWPAGIPELRGDRQCGAIVDDANHNVGFCGNGEPF